MDITCAGARITQTGLPAGDRIEVIVSDPGPPTSRRLVSVTTTSGPAGEIDVSARFALRGHHRLHVDVEDLDKGAEYGETGADIADRCHPRSWARLAAGGAGLAAISVAGWWWLRRRRPHARRHA